MILRAANLRQVGTPEYGVLGAEFDADVQGFVSNLPSLDYYAWISQIDPALGSAFPIAAFPTPVGNIDLANYGYTAYAQLCSTLRAVRLGLGQLATTVGFLSTSVPVLTQVFRGPVSAISDALNMATQVLDNPGFNAALAGLTAIPIVGWIIKAVVAVAKLVLKIVDLVRRKRADKQQAIRELRSLTPLAQWDPEIDAIQVRTIGLRLRSFDAAYVFLPRYAADSPTDFFAEMASSDPASKRVDAWRLLTRREGGLGFVPGTQNLHGAIEMPVGFCAGVRDLGDFFPTARQMSYQLWNTLLRDDNPGLFAVPAGRVARAWESYLLSALEYTYRDVRGWTCAADPQDGGSKVPRRDYLGDSGPYPTKHVDGRDSKYPKTVAIRGEGHRQALLEHLERLFAFSRAIDRKVPTTAPRYPTGALDFARTTPGAALANLHARQKAVLAGFMAAYVDTSRVRPGAGTLGTVPRFPALAESEDLRAAWDTGRRRLLESRELWKYIELDDVPGNPNDPHLDALTSDDRAFYDALRAKGLQPGKALRPPGLNPYVLLGPILAKPPPPPPPPEGYLYEDPPALAPRSRVGLALGLAGATLASGAGYLAYRRMRQGVAP